MTATEIATAVVGPVLAYLKIREERLKTSEKRDARDMIVEERLANLEKKYDNIDKLVEVVHKLDITLTEVRTVLNMCRLSKCESDGKGS